VLLLGRAPDLGEERRGDRNALSNGLPWALHMYLMLDLKISRFGSPSPGATAAASMLGLPMIERAGLPRRQT
jgi:hypothetical protein